VGTCRGDKSVRQVTLCDMVNNCKNLCRSNRIVLQGSVAQKKLVYFCAIDRCGKISENHVAVTCFESGTHYVTNRRDLSLRFVA